MTVSSRSASTPAVGAPVSAPAAPLATDASSPVARALIFERQLPHPPEKVWRALTESDLLAQWLLENDFKPEVGHRFRVRAKPLPGWTGVTHCQVTVVDPPHRLAYRWGDGSESAVGLRTVVTWTLTANDAGTLLRLEHAGFGTDDDLSYGRIGRFWQTALGRLAHSA